MTLLPRRHEALAGEKEVWNMPSLSKREPHGEATDLFSRFDRMFDEWVRMMPVRATAIQRWREAEEPIRVEEFREDGTLVIRADLPGIDPDEGIELTVSDGMLRIEAERREEEKREEKGYVRKELRYGVLSRSLPLPEGVTGADITATYKSGVLEVHVPEPRHEPAKKIAISKA
jgi:HSP20 family protein